jgi:two-component system, OmpR family, response regulator VicR
VKSVAKTKVQCILVVDDNPDDRELFRRILEKDGYFVVECSSGKEALAAVEKVRFELMTLDMTMPGVDGFEVLQVARSKQPELKIVAVSGLMHGRVLEPAKALGADAALDKNQATDLLLPLVRNLLKNPK